MEKNYVEAKVGRLLYMCEKLFYFCMDDARSIVAHAHDLQLLVGEISHLGCVLPPKFLVVAIVAKLPTTWRDFATSLQHKREEISIEDLIVALDVEEKARVKDALNQNKANIVQKKANKKNKGPKVNKSTSFKKKKTKKKDLKNITYYVCDKPGHMAKDCHDSKDRNIDLSKKFANVTIGEASTLGGYNNSLCLFCILVH